MPLPKGLARFNRAVSNRITGPFAKRLPWFCVLRHTGRTSGKAYETPMMAWVSDNSVVVALTYGPDVDWLKNSLASKSSEMVMRGKTLGVGTPTRIPTDQGMLSVPAAMRTVLKTLNVTEFALFPLLG